MLVSQSLIVRPSGRTQTIFIGRSQCHTIAEKTTSAIVRKKSGASSAPPD